VVRHSEQKYVKETSDLVLTCLKALDSSLYLKISSVLKSDEPNDLGHLCRTVGEFVHSLGFAFLPLDATLFLWDQILLKSEGNRLEIFIAFSIMLICLKSRIETSSS